MESLRIKDLNLKDSIRYYITSYAEYYNNYPKIVSITYSYDVLINEAELARFIKNIFKERFEFLTTLIEKGKEKGEVSTNIDTEGLVDIIQGTFRGVANRWRMNQYSFPFKGKVLPTLEMILKSF